MQRGAKLLHKLVTRARTPPLCGQPPLRPLLLKPEPDGVTALLQQRLPTPPRLHQVVKPVGVHPQP